MKGQRKDSFASLDEDDIEDLVSKKKAKTEAESPTGGKAASLYHNETGTYEFEDNDSQLSQLYIFRSASTLKMHLEILYKSVNFLNKKQILAQLE